MVRYPTLLVDQKKKAMSVRMRSVPYLLASQSLSIILICWKPYCIVLVYVKNMQRIIACKILQSRIYLWVDSSITYHYDNCNSLQWTTAKCYPTLFWLGWLRGGTLLHYYVRPFVWQLYERGTVFWLGWTLWGGYSSSLGGTLCGSLLYYMIWARNDTFWISFPSWFWSWLLRAFMVLNTYNQHRA